MCDITISYKFVNYMKSIVVKIPKSVIIVFVSGILGELGIRVPSARPEADGPRWGRQNFSPEKYL
jgi:hypothetical protein